MRGILVLAIFATQYQVHGREYCKNVSKIRSGPADYYITGLFPIYNTAPSRYSTNGLQYAEIVKYTLNKFNMNSSYTIGYEFFDTCGEAQLGINTEIVADMLIGRPFDVTSYVYTNKSLANNADMCMCENKTHFSRIIGVVGPASSSVSIRISNFLSHDQLSLISYASTSPTLSDKMQFPNFMRTIPSDTYQVQVIVDLILQFNWTYISIIASDNEYGRSGTDELLIHFKRHGICIGQQLLFQTPYDNKEIKERVEMLQNDKKAQVIVVFALSKPTELIFQHVTSLAIHNRTWLLTEAAFGAGQFITDLDPNVISGAFGIQPFTGIYSDFEEYFWKLSYHDSETNPFLKTFFHTRGVNNTNGGNVTLRDFKSSFRGDKIGNTRNAIVAFIIALRNYIDDTCNRTCATLPLINNRKNFNDNYLKVVQFKGLLEETVSFNSKGDITTALYVIQNMQKTSDSQVFKIVGNWSQKQGLSINTDNIIWATVEKPTSQCSDSCAPGFYALFDESKSCCWDCLRCSEGQVKMGYGENNNCTFCSKGSVPNNKRSGCIHIESISVQVNSFKGILLITLSCIGIVLSLIVMFTFLKFKMSIVIRSTNRTLSIIQVFLQFLLFSSLLLFFLEITLISCSIQLYTFGFLLSVTLSIILIKTEVLLRIFKCKVIINRSYARMTSTLEVIIVSFIIIVYILINTGLYLLDQRIKTVPFINYTDKTLTISCHFDTHLVAIFIFLIIIALVCGFQAFRARTLPDVFNEGSFIMYSVFVSSINMILILLLTQYGQEPADKTFILFILVFTTNLSLLTIMYGYKVCIVLFNSDTDRRKSFSTTFLDTMKTVNLQIKIESQEDSFVETQEI